jgi:hypothetical protein
MECGGLVYPELRRAAALRSPPYYQRLHLSLRRTTRPNFDKYFWALYPSVGIGAASAPQYG